MTTIFRSKTSCWVCLRTSIVPACIAIKSSKTVKLEDVRNWLRKQQTCINRFEENSCVPKRCWLESSINGKQIWQTCRECQTWMTSTDTSCESSTCFQNFRGSFPSRTRLVNLKLTHSSMCWQVAAIQKICKLTKAPNSKTKIFRICLQTKKIYFFTTENPETKASIVESFQRTLKSRMWKYFTHHRTLRYVDALPKLVDDY